MNYKKNNGALKIIAAKEANSREINGAQAAGTAKDIENLVKAAEGIKR
ncbi:MAG: hypothetical protein HDT13_10640 [Butyrivibrio sp.]|nr:hypothetical protein [Butyrivibrio sp.]